MTMPKAERDHGALHPFIESRSRTGFGWNEAAGEQDCVTFAARAAQAQTGVDYLKALGVRWKTAKAAAKALEARGGLAQAVGAVLREVPPAHAHRGDLGLLVIEGRESLVVIEGDLVVGAGLDGLVRQPRGRLTTAWSLDA